MLILGLTEDYILHGEIVVNPLLKNCGTIRHHAVDVVAVQIPYCIEILALIGRPQEDNITSLSQYRV